MISIRNDGQDPSQPTSVRTTPVLRRDPPVGPRHEPDRDVSHNRDAPRQHAATQIAGNLGRATHRLRGLLAAHFNEFGLSDVRFAVLQILRDCASRGCTQAELAAALDQSESSVSALVERMRDDNLLYRLRSKTDRRKRVLILTDQARQLLAQVELAHGERVAEILNSLSTSQLKELATHLEVLVEELSQVETPIKCASVSQDIASPHFESTAGKITGTIHEPQRPVA